MNVDPHCPRAPGGDMPPYCDARLTRRTRGYFSCWRLADRIGAGDQRLADFRDGNAVIGKVRRCLTPETSVNSHGKLVAYCILVALRPFRSSHPRAPASYLSVAATGL